MRRFWRPKYGIMGVDGPILFWTEKGRDRWADFSYSLCRLARDSNAGWARTKYFDATLPESEWPNRD